MPVTQLQSAPELRLCKQTTIDSSVLLARQQAENGLDKAMLLRPDMLPYEVKHYYLMLANSWQRPAGSQALSYTLQHRPMYQERGTSAPRHLLL